MEEITITPQSIPNMMIDQDHLKETMKIMTHIRINLTVRTTQGEVEGNIEVLEAGVEILGVVDFEVEVEDQVGKFLCSCIMR